MEERLQRIAQTEIQNHYQEADRLKDAAHHLLNSAEWHLNESRKWQAYLGEQACAEGRPQLRIVEN